MEYFKKLTHNKFEVSDFWNWKKSWKFAGKGKMTLLFLLIFLLLRHLLSKPFFTDFWFLFYWKMKKQKKDEKRRIFWKNCYFLIFFYWKMKKQKKTKKDESSFLGNFWKFVFFRLFFSMYGYNITFARFTRKISGTVDSFISSL